MDVKRKEMYSVREAKGVSWKLKRGSIGYTYFPNAFIVVLHSSVPLIFSNSRSVAVIMTNPNDK